MIIESWRGGCVWVCVCAGLCWFGQQVTLWCCFTAYSHYQCWFLIHRALLKHFFPWNTLLDCAGVELFLAMNALWMQAIIGRVCSIWEKHDSQGLITYSSLTYSLNNSIELTAWDTHRLRLPRSALTWLDGCYRQDYKSISDWIKWSACLFR